ncbi:hypothetical protein BWQ96_02740 [Gracilariopsis chorda]|uniref:Proteasome subunit alpha type n=1 Tax=Gracilariopsis chorda TaxID=448386 RepID=A0A2V3IZ88_9FLOR|nr:hypothetical protein BWQ96_02740 [Gracilariopsis chorda]|eukprot:PXF47409.1 hypothetical protein BWQ96_02740 [Gracilariopsis chorda]
MASIGTGYDLSSTIFSPDGRVFQIEYATKAVENSGTCMGIRCKDGVLLAVEKTIISKMLVPGSLRRAHIVDKHASLVVCGLISDGRVIVDRAREECENYLDFYGRPIPGAILADRLAHFVHLYTLHWSVRPFGCAILLGVHNGEKQGAQLYMIEPSGVSYRYFACAYGKGKQAARTELEKLSLNDKQASPQISCEQAVKDLAKIVVSVHDDSKDKEYEIEMIWVRDGKPAAMVPRDVVQKVHDEAKREAEADSDMEDE